MQQDRGIALLAGSRRRDAAAMGLVGAVGAAVLWSVSEPAWLFSDFYKAYFPTAQLLLEQGPQPTWPTDELCVGGFTNLPIVGWFFVPLARLDSITAGWLFLCLGLAAVAASIGLLVRLAGWPPCAIAVVCLFCFNGPLVNSLREGNTTHFVLLALLAALALWRARRPFLAGALLGLCALLKLPLLLLGAYALLRREWSVLAGGAAVILGCAVSSVVVFGPDINIGWYQYCVGPFLGAAIPAFNVQSIDGFLARLATGSSHLRSWDPLVVASAHQVARAVLVTTLIALVGFSIWRSSPAASEGRPERTALEVSIVLALALVTSPISWTHYYLLLLVPSGLYVCGSLPMPDDRATLWSMRCAIALTSLPVFVPAIDLGSLADVAARTVVSSWLAGGLIMLAVLLRALWHVPAGATPGRREPAGA